MPVDPKHVGRKYSGVSYEVSREKIKEFARATGDMNPLYLDAEKAKAGPHGGIVAPPMFAVVYVKDLLEKVLLDRELALDLAFLVHGEQEFEFKRLVRPGETIHSEAEILSITEKSGKDFVTCGVTCGTEAGETVTTGLATFVIRRI